MFADVNKDGATDIFQNMGGDSWWNREYGIDSLERSALFIGNAASDCKTATVMPECVITNRDAIGARDRLEADETHFHTVLSARTFQSQNEVSIILVLGAADEADVKIDGPSGSATSLLVQAGQRLRVREND